MGQAREAGFGEGGVGWILATMPGLVPPGLAPVGLRPQSCR